MAVAQENYAEKLIEVYENLVTLQNKKREVLTTRDVDLLGTLDEKILTLFNQALDISEKRELVNPDGEQRKKINELYEQINKLEQINQTIIEQSLSVINKIFAGIMKIVSVQPDEYTNTGKTQNSDDYGLSTVYEEA